jgi:hypothetical protein
MYLTTPIPTLTLDIISKFISEKYPSIQEIALKSYTSILMYIQLYVIVTLYIKTYTLII